MDRPTPRPLFFPPSEYNEIEIESSALRSLNVVNFY